MATENPGPILSRQAGTNVTNKRAVVEVAGNIVNRASAIGQQIDGVVAAMYIPNGATQTITTGDPAPICKSGVVIMESGNTITDQAEVMTDASGRAIPWDDSNPDYYAIGVARIGVTGAGKDVSVELYGKGQHNVPVDLT